MLKLSSISLWLKEFYIAETNQLILYYCFYFTGFTMTKRVHKIDIAFEDEIVNWYLDEDFASYLNLVSGLS